MDWANLHFMRILPITTNGTVDALYSSTAFRTNWHWGVSD
jgi:hypothetical protein